MPCKSTNKNSLIALMVFLMIVFSNSLVYSQTTTLFNDIVTSHWAFKDIAKMNAREVVSGYTGGDFKPGNPVSQLEAVLMAVHNMGTDLSTVNTDQTLLITVPAWAEEGNKRELLFAIQKGLIVPAENNFNANAGASRAWVAQLMVRMINKNAEAFQLASQPVPVQDGDAIEDWSKGYVGAAYKYQLMSGYPDNTFRPNQSVTRAEIVSLLSRSEQYLVLSQSVLIAKVADVSTPTMSLVVNNTSRNVNISEQALVFDSSGRVSTVSSIKKDDVVRVVLSGSTVKYVEILPVGTVVKTVTGIVFQVLTKEKVLVVKDDQQRIITGTLATGATVSSQNGEINDLSKIVVGDKVELRLDISDNVVSVLLLNQEDSTKSAAIIYNIDKTQKIIMIKNSAGKFVTYLYTDSMVIKLPNKTNPLISDLQVGDEVKIVVASGSITEIELVQAQKELTVSGKVMAVSQEKSFITVQRDDGTLMAYFISPKVVISISGVTTPLLSNVLENDQVDILIEEGQVTAIGVQNRNTEEIVTGVVAAVDTSNRILILLTDDGVLKAYEITSTAEYMINDSITTSLSKVDKDMKVKLRLLNNKVVYLETNNTVKGTLISLNQGLNLINIMSDDLGSRSYVLSSKVVVSIEGAAQT
jgi:hypothetical protein